jgi:hypothetical protein
MVSSGVAVAMLFATMPPPEGAAVSARSWAVQGDAVRAALAKQGYPWYEPSTDRVKPVLPWPDLYVKPGGRLESFGEWLKGALEWVGSWFRWLNHIRLPGIGSLGDVIAIGLAMLLLTVLLVGLLELLRRYRPLGVDAAAKAAVRAGSAQRIEGLPAGVRVGAVDPWLEAQRMRERGDFAGAIIHLFAHQLMTLHRLRQIRLVPGRTGRQLVRAVGDRRLRSLVEPTLRLFEAVYYGHRAPSAEIFDSVWAVAEEFERLTSMEAAR